VPTLHRRTQLAEEILATLREHFPDRLSRTALAWSVKIDEAQSHGLTIFHYAPRSSGAGALASIAEDLLARAPVREAAVEGATAAA
jgi:chromosome partitioning protein